MKWIHIDKNVVKAWNYIWHVILIRKRTKLYIKLYINIYLRENINGHNSSNYQEILEIKENYVLTNAIFGIQSKKNLGDWKINLLSIQTCIIWYTNIVYESNLQTVQQRNTVYQLLTFAALCQYWHVRARTCIALLAKRCASQPKRIAIGRC